MLNGKQNILYLFEEYQTIKKMQGQNGILIFFIYSVNFLP